VRPDGVLLWIPKGTTDNLPRAVKRLTAVGLTIKEAPFDYRSYNKIIHTLPLHPDASIAIADDDVSYRRDWLEGLVSARSSDRQAIFGYRTIVMATRSDGTIAPYREWRRASADEQSPVIATGMGGVLYPPRSLHADVTNAALFTRFCPSADDLWLRWMAYRQGTPVRPVGRFDEPAVWPGSQNVALWRRNVDGGENDEQIRRLIEAYGSPTNQRETGI